MIRFLYNNLDNLKDILTHVYEDTYQGDSKDVFELALDKCVRDIAGLKKTQLHNYTHQGIHHVTQKTYVTFVSYNRITHRMQ
jgi:hypothetical protein